MKYTNKFNLPAPIVNAVNRDDYVPGQCDVTVSQLIAPPKQVALKRIFDDDIVRDVSESLFALFGKAVHHVLEFTKTDENEVKEARHYLTTPNGILIGGKFDRLVLDSGTLQDYKICSVWSWVFGEKDEWEEQLNYYANLLRNSGYRVKKIQIIAIYRDWHESNAARDPKYPQEQVKVIELSLWSEDVCHKRMCEKAENLAQYCDLPIEQIQERDCTAEEMWEKPPTYALKKEGRKSAVKVADNEQDLHDYAEEKGFSIDVDSPFHIETRHAARKRCEKYCDAAEHCNQWQNWQAR